MLRLRFFLRILCLEFSGRFTPKADEPYQLPCSAS